MQTAVQTAVQTSVQRFRAGGDALAGILDLPFQPARRGVLVIVGGPQYRVGSHRQFVLLARALAVAGFAVLRFDYRGMGDSTVLRAVLRRSMQISAAQSTPWKRRCPTWRTWRCGASATGRRRDCSMRLWISG